MESLNVLFSPFGIRYSDIYSGNYIKKSFLDKMNNNELDKRFRSGLVAKIMESDRKKKFNELYNGFNMY